MANALSMGFADVAAAPQNARKGKARPARPLTGWDAVEIANLSMVPGVSDAASVALAGKEAAAGNWGAAGLNALGVLPFLPALGGMIKPLYHGSPHKFSRFDLSKIGTGEGAQAFGHGAYLSETPEVASRYAETLSGSKIDPKKIDFDIDESLRWLKQNAPWEMNTGASNLDTAILANSVRRRVNKGMDIDKAIDSHFANLEQEAGKYTVTPNMYEAALRWPDAAREAADPLGPQHFLDWDKPLSEQPGLLESARAAMHKGPQESLRMDVWARDKPNATVGDLIRQLEYLYGMGYANRALSSAGIPGIRYLDGGSRGAGAGTHNYVVFDDQLIELLKRNGEPLSTGNALGDLGAAGADDLAARLEAMRAANWAKGLPLETGTGDVRGEIARRNAIAMLGLPEGNTAADRASAMGFDYARRSQNEANPLNDVGWAMFKAHDGDIDGTMDAFRQYGEGQWVGRTDASVQDVQRDILRAIRQAGLQRDYQGTAAQLTREANPSSIVQSAGMWDAPELAEASIDVLSKRGVGGVSTRDGAVIWNPANIRSRFAAFDPARRGENDLLAGLLPYAIPAGLLGLMLTRPEEQY